MPRGDNLPPKQRLFLKEWAIDKNGAEAYKRAYKYTGNNADVLAGQLLVKLGKLGLIEAEIKAQEDKAIITANRVLTELARLATVDIAQAFDDNGNLLDIQDIPEDVRRAISGVEVEVLTEWKDGKKNPIGYTKKLKFWDKNKSLETIARHLRMLVDIRETKDLDNDIIILTDPQLAQIAAGKAKPTDFIK